MKTVAYQIRAIRPEEYPLLEDFLYEAIFVPEGETPPDRSIIRRPELQIYIEQFGERPDDRCLWLKAMAGSSERSGPAS